MSTWHIDSSMKIILVRYIPLRLRSKTRRRALPVLSTWMCTCWSRGTVNFALVFTTSVTNYLSQTFLSWVAISYGDLNNQYQFPLSRISNDSLEDNNMQWHPSLIRHYTNLWPCYWTGLVAECALLFNCLRFPQNIYIVCGIPTGHAYSAGPLVLFYVETCMDFYVETNLMQTFFSCFWKFAIRTFLGTS